MKKRVLSSVGLWLAGIVTVIYLPGSIHRLFSMPPAADKPLSTTTSRAVPAAESVILPHLGTARIETIARAESPAKYVAYAPNGAEFITSPFEEIQPGFHWMGKYVVQASIDGDISQFLDVRLETVPGESTEAIVPESSSLAGSASFTLHPSLTLVSHAIDFNSVRLGVASIAETRTIAEIPLENPLLERQGKLDNLQTKIVYSDVDLEDLSAVSFAIPDSLRQGLRDKTVAIQVQATDLYGNVRNLGYRLTKNNTQIYTVIHDTSLIAFRSLRVVAAPIHWTVFRHLPLKPDGFRMIAPTAFPVTDETRAFLSAGISPTPFAEIAHTDRFISAQAATPIRDTVVVAKGNSLEAQEYFTTFITYVPEDITGHSGMVATVTDQRGAEHKMARHGQFTNKETDATGTVGIIWESHYVAAENARVFSLKLVK